MKIEYHHRYHPAFGFEVIGQGEYIEQNCHVKACTVRMTQAAMLDYVSTDELQAENYTMAALVSQARRRAAWEREILDILGFRRTRGNFAIITRIAGDIFTIVTGDSVLSSFGQH